MKSTTITSEVHAVLVERFSDCKVFSTKDVIKILPWVEEVRGPENGLTSRVSAVLSYLEKVGAVVLIELKGHVRYYMTDKETLSIWNPTKRRHKTGYTHKG